VDVLAVVEPAVLAPPAAVLLESSRPVISTW
jgi:hypothetical protein